MAKDARTEFFYCIDGKPYRLTPGKDGITEQVITVLRDSYHSEDLNNRYEDELKNCRFTIAKTVHAAKANEQDTDPIETLADFSMSPEHVLFAKDAPPSLLDRVREILPLLLPEQRELFWKLCEGRQVAAIAREEGTTDNAIRSRRKKMFERIRKLYEQMYGDDQFPI
jgi:DNA-directed RNA polymerase specialized sigma24 family protein